MVYPYKSYEFDLLRTLCRVAGKSILRVKWLGLFETRGGTAERGTGWRIDVWWFHPPLPGLGYINHCMYNLH